MQRWNENARVRDAHHPALMKSDEYPHVENSAVDREPPGEHS